MHFARGKHLIAVLALAMAGAAVLAISLTVMRFGKPTGTQTPQGKDLYAAHCAVCHGTSGRGDGPGATVVRQPMRDFSDASAMAAVDDRYLFEIIKKGSSQFGRSNAMPAWGYRLSDEEIWALVAYIRSLPPSRQPAAPVR